MEKINFNNILNREETANQIKDILIYFEKNKHILTTKRGIYIYGLPGTGKTLFATQILKDLNYDIIKYDAGDIRNKAIIDTITKQNMSDKNILSLFGKQTKKIAVIMDEIDGMNNGDKGGINSLIKLIRPKKTKRQKEEDISCVPIICIGNYHIDKKIRELIKVCNTFEIKAPNKRQISEIICKTMPEIKEPLLNNIVTFTQHDLRKLTSIYEIYKNHFSILKNEIIQNIFKPKSCNEDSKQIASNLINNSYNLSDHNTIMNETDRTIVGLLWHENIIDALDKTNQQDTIDIYKHLLDNICYADYIDRITFQKQIWLFNEMSSLLKTLYNNHIYHTKYPNLKKKKSTDIRFTKVLTKYSTEYNNSQFIAMLCQQLSLDKKDMFDFFIKLRNEHSEEKIYSMLETYEINKLDINRIYRFLDKFTA